MRKEYEKGKTKENLLSDKEIERLENAAKGLKERLIVKGLLYTGMRVGEFVHMTRDWTDFEQGLIFIPRKQPCSCNECLDDRGGMWEPKTEAGIRAVPILPEAEEVFRMFFALYPKVMEQIPSRGSAYYHLQKVAKRAEIEHKVFPHALRGTFATMLATEGFTPFEIQDVMGWKNVETASDYIRLGGQRVKEAFDKKWRRE